MPSIPDLEKLLAKEPNDPLLLYGLAQEYAKRGDTDTASTYFDRCLAADPAYCYAYYHKARALAAAGRTADANAVIALGLAAAKKHRDSHAHSELEALADELA
ncbi:MAG: tetratricopeptide repeat protein [Planctomycetes bacterium]|nr:tetratricopeptide repeat protein [Planctomycetota bacterium]